VEFRFASSVVKQGLWVSIGSAFVALLLIAVGAWQARRPAALPPPAAEGEAA
jgi:hypothetical protein